MHAFLCEVVLALMNDGLAMAASIPMIATTIMISTKVNPYLPLFMLSLLQLFRLSPEGFLSGGALFARSSQKRVRFRGLSTPIGWIYYSVYGVKCYTQTK